MVSGQHLTSLLYLMLLISQAQCLQFGSVDKPAVLPMAMDQPAKLPMITITKQASTAAQQENSTDTQESGFKTEFVMVNSSFELMPQNSSSTTDLNNTNSIKALSTNWTEEDMDKFSTFEAKEPELLVHPVMQLNSSLDLVEVIEESPPEEFFYYFAEAAPSPVHTYNPWQKGTYSPEAYHLGVCGRMCSGEEVVDLQPYRCPTISCFNCICDRPRCEIYGMCCPQDPTGFVFPSLRATAEEIPEGGGQQGPGPQGHPDGPEPRGDDIGREKKTPEKVPTVKCDSENFHDHLYIQSCPANYADSQRQELCEREHEPGDDVTLDLIARVSDNATGAVYNNKYCAACNNVSAAVQWEVTVHCTNYLSVYEATTIDQLLSRSLRPHSSCTVEQTPGDVDVTRLLSCHRWWFSMKPIDRCNVTGFWPQYDEDVEKACHSMNEIGFQVLHDPYDNIYNSTPKTVSYKNIFCAICNLGGYPEHGYCPDDARFEIVEEQFHLRMFSFLLGFGSRESSSLPVFKSPLTFGSCETGEWPSPDGSCMAIHCSPGKVLVNDSCVTAIDQIRGLGYRLYVWYTPVENQSSTIPDFTSSSPIEATKEEFQRQIMDPISMLGFQYTYNGGYALDARLNVKPFVPGRYPFMSPTAMWLNAEVETQGTYSRDDVESLLLETFVENTVKFNYSSFQVEFQPHIREEKIDLPPSCTMPGYSCYTNDFYWVFSDKMFDESRHLFLRATPLLNCPHVQFSETVFTDEKFISQAFLPKSNVTLTLGQALLVFSEDAELNHLAVTGNGTTLSVCRDLLDSKLKEYEERLRREFYSRNFRSKLDEVSQAQYYLTLGCLCVSLACLALTLLTYLSFPVLRSAAGRNNIFLCTSLLLAQASLLASVHVSGPQTLCTVLGMVTHFLWLWMFTWSFVCCFHMFRVFTAKTRQATTEKSQSRAFRCTVLVSLLFPGLVLSAVIGASQLSSGGSRTGYGHKSCYLDSSLLIGLATAFPLVLISVSNLVFFAATVTKISSVRKLQTHGSVKKEDRNNLYIYIKLSTMTGSFWIVQILAEAVDSDILRFVALFLNGLQGAFIFFSYVWNKRVLNLYLRSLGLKTERSTSSENQGETTVSTIRALASKVRKANAEERPSCAVSMGEVGDERGERCASTAGQGLDRTSHRSFSSGSSGVHCEQDGGFDSGEEDAIDTTHSAYRGENLQNEKESATIMDEEYRFRSSKKSNCKSWENAVSSIKRQGAQTSKEPGLNDCDQDKNGYPKYSGDEMAAQENDNLEGIVSIDQIEVKSE